MPNKSYKVFHKACTDVWVLLTDSFRSRLRSFLGKLSRAISGGSFCARHPCQHARNPYLIVQAHGLGSSGWKLGFSFLCLYIYVMLFSKILESSWKRFMIALLFWCSWLQLPFVRPGPSNWTLWRSELLRGKSLAYSLQPRYFFCVFWEGYYVY